MQTEQAGSPTLENQKSLSPFRADHVGSFLRPKRLLEARQKFQEGQITKEELTAVENEAILDLIGKQQAAGLKSITDGEFRRSWWHFDFMKDFIGTRQIEGPPYEFHGIKTPGRLIDIFEPIRFNPNHPFFEHFTFLKDNLPEGLVAKQTIPSPNMFFQPNIMDTPVYKDIYELAKDLSEAYRLTIAHFYEIGCRYLQLDDVFWATLVDQNQREAFKDSGMDPDEFARIAAKVLNDALVDKPEDLLVTMHVCRGNFHSAWIYSGGYEVIADALFSVNIDGFFLEYDDERSGDFAPLAKSDNQNIVLGLLTSKTGELEDAEAVKTRIKEANKYVSLKNLFLSPQCGFSSTEDGNKLSEDQQWEKVKFMVDLANEVWGDSSIEA